MVSEHMLTVGCDPRNWQAHSKVFSLQLSLSKIPFTSLLFCAYSKIPFSETIPLSPFYHTKIRLMRPLQEVQDIGQPRPLRNEEDFTIHYDNGSYDGWKLRRLGEFEGFEEFPDWYDLGKLPLWNLSNYGSCQYLRSRYRRKTETWNIRTQSFCQENLKAGDINYGMIAHGNDKSRNTAIHDVIARLCYCTVLS